LFGPLQAASQRWDEPSSTVQARTPGRAAGLMPQDWGHRSPQRFDAGREFATDHDIAPPNIPGRQILQRSAVRALALDPCWPAWRRSQRRMDANASLDARLLVSTQNRVFVFQGFPCQCPASRFGISPAFSRDSSGHVRHKNRHGASRGDRPLPRLLAVSLPARRLDHAMPWNPDILGETDRNRSRGWSRMALSLHATATMCCGWEGGTNTPSGASRASRPSPLPGEGGGRLLRSEMS